jgi:hypothetical protein
MTVFLNELFVNVLGNVIFWLLLGFTVRRFLIRRARQKFLTFFGLNQKRKLVVYLSNLWLPQLRQKPWGQVLSGHEFDVTKTFNSLFGSSPFSMPEMVRGLVDSFWIKAIDLTIEISPLDHNFDTTCNMIVVGSTLKNSIRRYLLNKNLITVKIDGEQAKFSKGNLIKNSLKQQFIILKGKQSGESIKRNGKFNLAVIEKVVDNHNVGIMCVGLRGDSTWASAEYLARHWAELESKFGADNFARCLWFPYTEKPMTHYIEPVHIRDIP